MINTYKGAIAVLEDNQVFVFGSNLQGFSGAGSAGYASFNEAGNVWRKYEYQKKPNGWKGKWNVKGVAEGFQEGEIGKSYAIPTVTRCGLKRSIPLSKIKESIRKFYQFAAGHEGLKFYVAQENKMGLNGYSPAEMAEAYKTAGPIPNNVYFEENFAKLLV